MGQYAPLAERRVVGEGCTWGPVKYDRIRSRHIEWSTHRGAKGLVRVNDLINKYTDDNVISVPQVGCPPHAEKVGITMYMYWRI